MRERDRAASHWPEGIGVLLVIMWIIRMAARLKPSGPLDLPEPPITLDDFIVLMVLIIATCAVYIMRRARRTE